MSTFIKKLAKSPILRPSVLNIAMVAMLITCIFVPVDSEYFGYFNFQTLATLFCTLAVVAAFSHIYIFEIISKFLVIKLNTLKLAVLALVFITFFGSMLLANDMALLTFLPLGYYVLDSTGNKKYMAYTFIMQNIAANLGGLVTPFGNPQNLYLYAYYKIDAGEFTGIMLPTFLISIVLIIIFCCFIPSLPLTLVNDNNHKLRVKRTVVYSALFVFSLLIVFRIVSALVGTIVVVASLIILDKKALKEVNYELLLTFCVFFVFSGNLARIEVVSSFFKTVLPMNTLLFGILSCQIISNVPSAVLLSHFTSNYHALLPAVNIGGLGTPIASLASLITLTHYRRLTEDKNCKHIESPDNEKAGNNVARPTSYYLKMFTLINFIFLVILYVSEYLR